MRGAASPKSSETLVREANEALPGDTRAFAALVRRHQGHVVANCRLLLGSVEDANEAAQDVFVKAFRKLPGFEGRSTFRTWLQRIKINECLSRRRKRPPAPHLDVDDDEVQRASELSVPAHALDFPDRLTERERIRAILAAMPEPLRVALVLCDVDELTYEEVARSLGIGLSATKMRIKRAREHFRREYERASRDEERAAPHHTAVGGGRR